ncbi:hypothetical protein ABZ863_24315 [Saccharomonospora sp. NPDC046836]|uniref:hypothetical protein n=1 Tax=Saccharomonospora sp. NPDC046836 TaxID=3156921 RepID=UPI0033D4EDB5
MNQQPLAVSYFRSIRFELARFEVLFFCTPSERSQLAFRAKRYSETLAAFDGCLGMDVSLLDDRLVYFE